MPIFAHERLDRRLLFAGSEMAVTEGRVFALQEEGGRIHLLVEEDLEIKVKGIGRINPSRVLAGVGYGDHVTIGQKRFLALRPGVSEISSGMSRRAQIITPKDASLICTSLGVGQDSKVLEIGWGSGGLSLHLANAMGGAGTLVTVENRLEHADVARSNLYLAKQAWGDFPELVEVHGDAVDKATIEEVARSVDGGYDAISIDLPEAFAAVPHYASMLRLGGKLACYCPVTSQLEQAWVACEEAGLEVNWAGERIDRTWSKASKGGVRPDNNPMGHTAFVLIAQRCK